ncbi:hypothetical protein SAMD00079811_58500 [Scytonema sp. HK-05]|nr:hypothetical protein SAMD00079811_58500 [Scytonema sp. HK-05]
MDISPNAPKIWNGVLRYATTHPTKLDNSFGLITKRIEL